MSELIDRQVVIDEIKSVYEWHDKVTMERLVEHINNLPTIQPVATDTNVGSNSEIPNSSDCISRQAAIDIFDDYNVSVENGDLEAYRRDRKRLCELPSVQPEPHEGHWIWVAGDLECSKCHTRYPDLYPDYDNAVACPHCGCKMEVEHDSDLHAE